MHTAALPLATATTSAATAPRPATYRSRLAAAESDLRAAQRLRFEVFNLELDEGLPESYDTGLDADPFDAVCDHLIVEETDTGAVVGTYRLQTGSRAAAHLGYYSEREFDFSPLEPMRAQMLELGRACIHGRHRNFTVLNLLWKGIAAYAQTHGARYLVGCSSLTSQDPGEGAAAWQQLASHRAPVEWMTAPQPGYACALDGAQAAPVRIPRLMTAYLALGAELCAPPAIDRAFRTIDFLTRIDIETPRVRALQQRGRFTA